MCLFFLCFVLQVDPQNFPQGQVVGLLLWLVGMRLFHFAMCCRDPGFKKFDRMRALSAGPLFLISFFLCCKSQNNNLSTLNSHEFFLPFPALT